MKKVLQLAVTEQTAAQMVSPSLARVVAGFGDFPNAIFNIFETRFTMDGARFEFRAYRNAEAPEPLPLADPIVVDMTWDELRAIDDGPALESAMRDAIWAVALGHPKMERNGVNIFDGGELVEV
jgi:hypothetical protein